MCVCVCVYVILVLNQRHLVAPSISIRSLDPLDGQTERTKGEKKSTVVRRRKRF
jgi:hypothetical protein